MPSSEETERQDKLDFKCTPPWFRAGRQSDRRNYLAGRLAKRDRHLLQGSPRKPTASHRGLDRAAGAGEQGCAVGRLSPPKPMPAMPEVFAPGVGYVPRAYSAAFPIPKRSLRTLLRVQLRTRSSIRARQRRWIPQVGVFAATPRLEIVSPIQDRNVPSEELAAHSQGRNADPLGSSEPSRPVQPLPVQPLSEKLSIERSHQVSAGNSPPIIPAKEPIATVLKALSQASAEAAGKTELRKPEEIKPIPQDRVFCGRKVCSKPTRRKNGFPRRFSLPGGGEGSSTSCC